MDKKIDMNEILKLEKSNPLIYEALIKAISLISEASINGLFLTPYKNWLIEYFPNIYKLVEEEVNKTTDNTNVGD